MRVRYVTIGGKRYRVEFNWNALMAFLVESGRDTMEGLASLKNLKPSDIIPLAYAAIKEGERIDGRELSLTKEGLGECLDAGIIREIISIFAEQNSSGKEKGDSDTGDADKAKKKSIFQRSAKSGE